MNYLVKLCCILICIVSIFRSSAQDQIGLTPPSLKWYQINTAAGKTIYPAGLDSLAFLSAKLMDYMYFHDSTLLPARTTRIPSILHPLSVLPAGFSTVGPKRNEYYLTGPQNNFLGPVHWPYAMIPHEYRHTQQFQAANEGFTWVYKVLMGQTGHLFNTLMTQPLWFREGDAVWVETVFTNAGRGRRPGFAMEYRALRTAGIYLNYDQAHWLSFNRHVPNPYHVGFNMVTHARTQFGDTIWRNVLHDVYNRKFIFYPFSRSLKRNTGMNSRELYNATMRMLDSAYAADRGKLKLTKSRSITPELNKGYTQYRFPHYASDSTYIASAASIKEIRSIYLIDKNGNKKLLTRPGIYTSDHENLSVAGNLIAWAESSFHPRWRAVDYSVITVYDLERNKKRRLTHRTRYFSPAPSWDNSRIAVVEIDKNLKNHIIILDAKTGDVMKHYPSPGNEYPSHLRWSKDDKTIYYVSLTEEGNAIVEMDISTGERKEQTAYTHAPILSPYQHGDYIYFSAGFTEVNNIYALNRTSGAVYQVTSVENGAFDPAVSPSGDKLVYSEYNAYGYSLKEISFEIGQWETVSIPATSGSVFNDYLEEHTTNLEPLVTLDTAATESKRYHTLFPKPLSIYGWIPLPNIPDFGAEFYGQDIMSINRTTLGILYSTDENRFKSYLRYTYAGLYPLIHFEGGLAQRHVYLDSGYFVRGDWVENSLKTGLELPFNLTRGIFNTNLSLRGFYSMYDVKSPVDVFFTTVKGEFSFSRLRSTARKHIHPRWGQVVNASYETAIDNTASKMQISARLYFPGLFKTHSLNTALSYQDHGNTLYRFASNTERPRGYDLYPFNMETVFSLNYAMPLFYPDVAIPGVVLFHRVRVNGLFDYAVGETDTRAFTRSSVGLDLITDFRLFRLFQMDFGVRYAYLLQPGTLSPHHFNIVISRFEFAN